MTTLDIPEATDDVPCPLCGAREGRIVGQKGRFGMPVQNLCCATCSTVFVSPRPSAAAMATYYRSTYRQHYGGVGYSLANGQRVTPGEPGFEPAMANWHQNQAQNALLLAATQPGARVLEVGCRHGQTLAVMKQRLGIQAHGIEPGENEAEEARKNGVDCFSGQLEEFDAQGALFDQIQLFHVLEHVHEPLAALLKLRELLKPGGALLVEVPNVYKPYGLLEENFFQNVHLVSYSPSTLPALVKRAGFDVTRVVDQSSLFVVARRGQHALPQALPLPFDAALLGAPDHNAEWVATRLATYASLEKLQHLLKQRGYFPELLAPLLSSLGSPAFLDHLVDRCAFFVEQLAGRGLLDEALAVTLAVANGPHPEELRQEFRAFAERIGGSSAAMATAV